MTLDIPLAFLLLLLATTLIAWVAGFLVYPFGLLVLSMMIVIRLLHLRGKRLDRENQKHY